MFKSDKGVSAVEFALIAPFLFILTFGIIEFSILLFDKAVVTNASREGARAAVIYNAITVDDRLQYDPVDEAQIREVVSNYIDNHLISLGASSTPRVDSPIYTGPPPDRTPGVIESGGDVTIRVAYTYDFLVFPNLTNLIGGTFDGTIDLVGTTIMRME